MITMFNVDDEVEITFRGKIDSISIGLNSSGNTEIQYGVIYTQPNGYVDHIMANEDKLMELTKVEKENENESET